MIVPIQPYVPERGQAPGSAPVSAVSGKDAQPEPEMSFWDLLDVVNPLQHIPVVSSVYRHLTGDEIGGAARLTGGLLYGGPIGFASSAANLGLEITTGHDLGAHVMNLFDSSEEAPTAAEFGEDTGVDASTAFRASDAYGESGGASAGAGGSVDVYDIEIPG